uniref:F-box domain-containing protein n=1 Tax=Kalanchoe fedtschenkoi TaxID=63787 RepID=A0A7N0TTN2_KALFE
MDETLFGRHTKRGSVASTTTIHCLDHDLFCIIFSFLDLFDLVRCSAVCTFWNRIVCRSQLLHALFHRHSTVSTPATSSDKCLTVHLEELALERHRSFLLHGRIDVDQWKCHSVGISQCRMKMGSLLSGVGDKAVRIWSVESYKCLEEYYVPDMVQLDDFDFDESKVVGLIGTRICIWRRHGKRSTFPSHEGTLPKGICMRYSDPEAFVGCEDGTAHVFDMYSRRCSRIISMTCLSDQRVATLKPSGSAGIKTLCLNRSSHLVFAGSTAGHVYCWDLRKMKMLWETKASTNVIYTLQAMHNDKSTLAVGGIDGVLRLLKQDTGEIVSRCVMETEAPARSTRKIINARRCGRRISEDTQIDSIPRTLRPPITCLAVGMKKIVTTHNCKNIRVWKFS